MYNEKAIKTIHLVLTITEILNEIDINTTSLKDMRRQLELTLGIVENSLDERKEDIKFIVKHIIKRKKNKQSWEEKYKLLEQEKNEIFSENICLRKVEPTLVKWQEIIRDLKKKVETLEQAKNVILPVRSRHLKKQVETLTNENETLLKNINMLRLKNNQLQGDNDKLQEKCYKLQYKYDELQEEYNDDNREIRLPPKRHCLGPRSSKQL